VNESLQRQLVLIFMHPMCSAAALQTRKTCQSKDGWPGQAQSGECVHIFTFTCFCDRAPSASQGIRPARQTDLAAIQELLAPLEQAGITKKRSRRELTADIPCFTVVERESKVRIFLDSNGPWLATVELIKIPSQRPSGHCTTYMTDVNM